ncbi:transient receptor potential channel pyrexia [Folsomia candida]|uniref:Transient receptor potential channel pyrexia n=1 Tax=Folsomia candida TaxID=158441 RepID=A0A226DZF4_FOLCA|nr:transient receptor potential channel pyrexia [Folsomia candida]OXA50107.1 Transient receptor potential channel pyrexia [Folsomia candida]
MSKNKLIGQFSSMESDLSIMIPRVRTNPDNNTSLLLHEAVRRYDAEYLQALLEENGCDVHVKDADGKGCLHVLLEDGFMGHLNSIEMINCLDILINRQIDLNHSDRLGNTPLSLTVNNEFQKCTMMLLNSGAHCTVKLASKISLSMPDVLVEILNSGISIEEGEMKGETFVKLDWRPILQFPQTSTGHTSFKHEQKETQFLYNLLDAKSDVRQRFLYHPLVRAFLYLKNSKMASRFWIFFLISTLYPILYGVFIYFLYFEHCKIESDNENSTINASSTQTRCDINVTITVAAGILLLINASWTLVEVYMLLRVDVKYLISWRTWVIRVSIVVMGVTLWPGLFYQNGYNITWQYPIASLGIFLAWVLFLMQVGLYQGVSIYLEMLVKILISVLKIILMFLPLFIGFYMGFNLLFTDMGSVFGFIMMTVDVGSVGYDTMSDDAKERALWFQALANTFCVGFLVIIVIVFMNFLLAMSIKDVETLRGHGKLASVSRMIQNLFVIDLLYANSVLVKKTDLKDGKHYYKYNPKILKQELPVDIRNDITQLLKERRLTNLRKERLRMENESLEINNGNETTRILLMRIAELEDQMDSVAKKVANFRV